MQLKKRHIGLKASDILGKDIYNIYIKKKRISIQNTKRTPTNGQRIEQSGISQMVTSK